MFGRHAHAALALLLVGLAFGGLAAAQASGTQLEWTELADPALQDYDDPFLALGNDQILDLSTIARLRDRLDSTEVSEDARPRLQARIDETVADLSVAGLDANALLALRDTVAERRMRAALAGNPDLDGRMVSLSGFLVPAPDDPDGMAVAYLVPQFGMCSHYPPPVPNQLIRLRLPADVIEAGLQYASTVTGQLQLHETDREMFVLDGPVRMWSSWIMEVTQVTPWDSFLAFEESTTILD